eukprot:m51a1_g2662 hypothetical protein (358) ;mRNA; r:651177-652404
MEAAAEWEHVEYEKMGESTQRWAPPVSLMSKGRWRGAASQWVVTEKVHGANFCFVTDGHEVKPAKRGEFLSDDDDFFGYKEPFGKYQGAVRELALQLRVEDPTIQRSVCPSACLIQLKAALRRVSVYGELFGGAYRAGELTDDEVARLVQTEILYCPRVEFYAFDLAVSRGHDRAYFDFQRAAALFERHGLFYARPLLVGSFEQAMQFNLDFETTIPARLGLAPLGRPNKAEGIVIKPFSAVVYVDAGGRAPVRAIVKRKSERFCERSVASGGVADCVDVEAALGGLVNSNRVAAALSKVGRKKGAAAIALAAVDDALATAKEDEKLWARWTKLPAKTQKDIRATLQRRAADILNRK